MDSMKPHIPTPKVSILKSLAIGESVIFRGFDANPEALRPNISAAAAKTGGCRFMQKKVIILDPTTCEALDCSLVVRIG
jgi:hypothetical protein